MGDWFLHDLAAVCRTTGRPVIEMDGWQTRARGSGGYDVGKPDHVACHHTASPPSSDGWPDADYCTYGDDDAPLTNLYINRAGTVWVCAAGATNTNGSGDCPHLPSDTLNSSAIGIEAGNDGVGEPWPPAQQDAYIAVVSALCATYGIPTDHVESHAEWAPGRKSDPAGPSRWAEWGTWAMDGFRAELTDGGFMALSDQQQRDLYDRVMGSLPGPYSTEQRDPAPEPRVFVLDNADGHYIVQLLERIAAKLGA